MKKTGFIVSATLAALAPFVGASAQESTPSNSELWEIIQEQRAEIDTLKNSNAVNRDEIEATGDALETLSTNWSNRANWFENTQLGGYGELHYNNLDAENSENDVNEIDFHRFVLFVNHQFNDRLRFFSEIELEHSIAGDEEDGEFELEQAYIQYDLNDEHYLQGGVFLLPVGILNETHEPNTFYGVERNNVEKLVIPTTWWEGGAAIGGRYANGLSWDFAVTSGLEIGDDYQIRKGRNKVSEAAANDPAYTARIKYTGLTGLELAASYQYQQDANQGENADIEEGQLFETHAVYNKGPFSMRALWAGWDFSGEGIETAKADDQSGWYVEPSLKFRPGNYDIGVFARYESLDAYKRKGDNNEFELGEFDEWSVGINYWPVPNVVIKADYRQRDHDDRLTADNFDFDGVDIGLGYSF